MHAYSKMHAPMGVILACCCQNHLQLGVLSSQSPRLGVLFYQKAMLGILPPQKPMNISGQLGKNLLQGERVDQEDASHPELAQSNSIFLHPRCLISGSN